MKALHILETYMLPRVENKGYSEEHKLKGKKTHTQKNTKNKQTESSKGLK